MDFSITSFWGKRTKAVHTPRPSSNTTGWVEDARRESSSQKDALFPLDFLTPPPTNSGTTLLIIRVGWLVFQFHIYLTLAPAGGDASAEATPQTALPIPGAPIGTWPAPEAASSCDSRTKAKNLIGSSTAMGTVVPTSMVISSIFQRTWSPWRHIQKDSACAFAAFSIHCWFSESGRHERSVTLFKQQKQS